MFGQEGEGAWDVQVRRLRSQNTLFTNHNTERIPRRLGHTKCFRRMTAPWRLRFLDRPPEYVMYGGHDHLRVTGSGSPLTLRVEVDSKLQGDIVRASAAKAAQGCEDPWNAAVKDVLALELVRFDCEPVQVRAINPIGPSRVSVASLLCSALSSLGLSILICILKSFHDYSGPCWDAHAPSALWFVFSPPIPFQTIITVFHLLYLCYFRCMTAAWAA